ncbi:hypothetical protein FQA47_015241 [Oryzias melastigma]|uniref:Uncharacterized protein n=1 Tax=Oryzias melastigma TaxID=30732 RepID=A0A834CIY1_ORYME|nr:hypothetical protein FQA47_015241 [Oryzias melastigma]
MLNLANRRTWGIQPWPSCQQNVAVLMRFAQSESTIVSVANRTWTGARPMRRHSKPPL